LNWLTLSWAITEAGVGPKDLLVCYACAPDSPLAVPGASARMGVLERVEPTLARVVAAARLRLGTDRLSVVVRPEPPGELLVRTASPGDVIVVGAPPRPGWFARESTTRYVLRHAPCPVVVVRPSADLAERAHGRAFSGHIVVGVDGSVPARGALGFGFTYAAEHRRPLVAVNVTPHGEHDLWVDDVLLETHLTAEPAALELLAVEVERWRHKCPDVSVKRAVLVGRPVAGLLRAADGAAALVVGGGRRGAVSRIVGSVRRELVPGVALGAEPASPDAMRRPPRPPQESVLGGVLLVRSCIPAPCSR
jgi:nucleotide-binding universal stress UspA family protein